MKNDKEAANNKQYALEFLEQAIEEYESLDRAVRAQIGKKLIKRLSNPHVPKDRLKGLDGAYKIKLRKAGVRLVYQVIDNELVVLVIAVGSRSDNEVYKAARKALDELGD